MSASHAFALIGAGGFGLFHRNALSLLQREERARLVAVADPTLKNAPELRQELVAQGARLYADYAEMLAAESSLDAVTVASPIPFHEEMTLACLRRGVAVYLEKPPAPLIQQLEGLIAADGASRVHVGFQLIASRWAQQLKRWIVEGRLGSVTSMRAVACWPRTDAYYRRARWVGKMVHQGRPVFDGPATNALSHLVHCLTYFAGEGLHGFAEPVTVQGELYRARDLESYDTACLRGRFPGGIEFSLAVTHATQQELPFQLRVEGSKGWAEVSRDGRRLESSWGGQDFWEETDALVDLSYRRFADFVEGRVQRPPTTLRETRGYVLATNALWLASGGVTDIAPEWKRTYASESGWGWDVPGLYQVVREHLHTGQLFSELFPWGRAGELVSGVGLRECLLTSESGVRPKRKAKSLVPV